MFFVEVMGRDAGFIALESGIATGAEAVLIPETPTYVEELVAHIEQGWRRKKMCHIIIVAEGDDSGGAIKIAAAVKERFDHIETRVTILGHVQRGGAPSCYDRVLGSRLGFAAVEALLNKNNNVMVGVINGEVVHTPLSQAVKQHPHVNPQMLELVKILSS
jgi:6-phosphofructokinase 1